QQAEKEVPPYAGPPNPFERINFFHWSHWDRTSLFLQGGLQRDRNHKLRLRLYYDAFLNRLERFDDWTYTTQATPRSFSSEFDDESIGGSGEWAWTRHPGETWIGVLHFRRDHHEETANLLPGRRTPALTFIDHTGSVGLERRTSTDSGWKTMAGLSLDLRSPQKAEDGQRGGASFKLESMEAWNAVFSLRKSVTERLSTNLGIARKSRLPSMIDRYSYRQGRSIPNPGLEAETAWNSEAGLIWKAGTIEVAASVFYNRVQDLMQEAVIGEDPSVPGRLVSQTRNVGKADFMGTELSASWSGPGFEAVLNYAFTERSLDDNTSGYNLVGVPRHEAHLHIRFQPLRGLEVIPVLHLATERLSSEFFDGDPVDGFAIASLRTTWEWREGLRLELGIENIFDDLYAYDRGYPEPGREFTLGIRWQH
ncbi:MAG TPA: TonB-dependent receptor, partial [Oceanipulchritudo sp.]|nr:TonB-dependent receptor [Oceanipulchritudo sp.]